MAGRTVSDVKIYYWVDFFWQIPYYYEVISDVGREEWESLAFTFPPSPLRSRPGSRGVYIIPIRNLYLTLGKLGAGLIK